MPSPQRNAENILLFANFFLDQANRELERNLIGFDAMASEALQNLFLSRKSSPIKKHSKTAALFSLKRLHTH